MRTGFLIVILGIFAAIQVPARCEGCKSVADEVIDFCFRGSLQPYQRAVPVKGESLFPGQFPEPNKGLPTKFHSPDYDPSTSQCSNAGLATPNKNHELRYRNLPALADGTEQWRQLGGSGNWASTFVTTGYTLLPSGLAAKLHMVGMGEAPEKGNGVAVHCTGYLESGKCSPRDRQQSFQFTDGASQVIKGWDESIAAMAAGSRHLLGIPPHLGHGHAGAGAGVNPQNTTLYIDIQHLSAE